LSACVLKCGVAILTCGKLEHKLRFAFHVYEHDREGVIRSGDLVHAYIAIHNSKRYTVAHAEKAVANLVAAMECKRRDQVRPYNCLHYRCCVCVCTC
jgi:hypothetical protein